jgi:hypothetical protein
MPSLQPVVPTSQIPHSHQSGERCPYCDQPIPNEKAARIRARVEVEERKRTDALTSRLTEQFAREKQKAQAEAREEAKKAAELAARDKVALAERQRTQALNQYNTLKAGRDQEINKRVLEARKALEKEKITAVNTEIAKQFEEKRKLTTMVHDLQRRLEKQTADQLGEGAEIDLFDALKEEFPNDRIERIGKGMPGADIKHVIIHNHKQAGTILYDSKNRNKWLNEYVEKLARDQRAAKADYAILAALKFPAEARQIHLQDGVIVANPARVPALARILREHIVRIHMLGLSSTERTGKTEKLYRFITSKRCTDLLDSINTHADDLLDLQEKEKRAHDTTWKRQGQLLRSIQKVRGDLGAEIDQILDSD